MGTMEGYFLIALFCLPIIWFESYKILMEDKTYPHKEFFIAFISSGIVSCCLALGWPVGMPLTALSSIMRAFEK